MNIVQVANFHAPKSGGLRVAVDALRAGYLSRGHSCSAIVPGPADTTSATLSTIRSPRITPTSNYRVIVRPAALRGLLDQLQPDHLEVHDKLVQPWVWTWARQHSVPVVLVSHERLTDTLPQLLSVLPQRVARSIAQAITRTALRRSDAIVTCSAYAAADFPSVVPQVVPLGVDLEVFRPVDDLPPWPRNGPLRLITVGRLSPEKRVDLAVDTVAALVSRGVGAELLIVGSGPAERALRRRSAGLPVTFHGQEPDRDQIARLLAAADIALVPGPAETFGLAALEALACGTPIVVVDGCGTAELVAGYPNAGLSAEATPSALTAAVLALAQIPRDQRRAAARVRAECFSWPATVQAMLDIHAKLSARAARAM